MPLSEAFWKIHSALPRQAPGSDKTTMHLFDLAGRPSGRVLDIGCGQGRASTLLAKAGLNVVAIDTHQPFLDELDSTAAVLGLSDKITTRNISMDAIDYHAERFDVIWAEGSAYILGWEKAISTWSPLLKSGGILVATECCWLVGSPSEEAKQFWAEGYPAMLTAKVAADVALRHGYSVVATYELPASDWFDEYYNSIKRNHALLSVNADASMRQAISSGRREIELYEMHNKEYGYVGFVLKKN